MTRYGRTLGFSLLSALVFSAAPAVAQMTHQPGGDQMSGQTHTGMQGSMMGTDQMMRDIDGMMTNANSMMRDLSTMHTGMGSSAQHDQMMKSMQGMLDQMRLFRGTLQEMMKDPNFSHNQEGMKAFQQACQDLKQMTGAFQSMTKNLTQAMKGMSHGQKQ